MKILTVCNSIRLSLNRFTMTPQKWIENTNAKGIISIIDDDLIADIEKMGIVVE